MSKEKKLKQEKGSIAVFAVATIFSLIFILGGVFAVSAANRKNQLRTLLKIKEIYASEIEYENEIPKDTIADYVGKPANNEKNIKTVDANGNPVTIPAGFIVVPNSPEGTASDRKVEYTYSGDGIPTVQDGIVVEDEDGNQFVWIPVGTIKNKDGQIDKIELGRYNVFATDSEPFQPMSSYKSSTEDDEVYQSQYEIDGYRELTKEIEGKNTIAKALELFKTRTEKNNGFYIARYESSQSETGKPMSKASQTVWSGIQQPEAAEKARAMYDDKSFYGSDLINSYAWDTALIFIQKYNKKYTNYASIEGKSISTTAKKTGENVDVVCNIHDMCGNYAEWSTENCNDASWPSTRRGGNYSQDSRITSDRIAYCPSSYLSFIGFRVIVY